MSSIHIDGLSVAHGESMLVDCSFEIGRSLALVGESGSGKSLILKALLGLCDTALDVRLQKRSPFEWNRGKSVALVPQNPFTALSPLTRIKDQMFLTNERSEELFSLLGLNISLLERYPNELSGGQLQRVVVAMALGSNPKLLLLDEPTTALDGDSRMVMIEQLLSLQEILGFSLLFVTHDMGVAAALCEDICVLQKGKIIESGNLKKVLENPKMPYTCQLIEADFKNREYRK
ncbi:MAG: ATP-binding cassette domain-containing protein [Epsilonproteobacteria bacterium]|nr:ATP-binding cassette domain-containing protein [Campylobacterota bacterium]